MVGWGRVLFSIGFGILVVAGCGGRTGTLEDDYGGGAENSGAQGGSPGRAGSGPVAGRPPRGGSGNVGGAVGVAGAIAVGGQPSFGGYGGAIYPIGGYAGYGGGFPIGGYGGYAGVPYGGYAGVPFGGYAGYGGQPPVDCLQCIGQACSTQLVTCFQDFGCLSIFDCMQSTGCQAFQCYTDQYCRTTIDQWGGPNGVAMGELLQTFTCALQAGCQCD